MIRFLGFSDRSLLAKHFVSFVNLVVNEVDNDFEVPSLLGFLIQAVLFHNRKYSVGSFVSLLTERMFLMGSAQVR